MSVSPESDNQDVFLSTRVSVSPESDNYRSKWGAWMSDSPESDTLGAGLAGEDGGAAGWDVQLGAVEACGVADAQQYCFLRWFLRYFLR